MRPRPNSGARYNLDMGKFQPLTRGGRRSAVAVAGFHMVTLLFLDYAVYFKTVRCARGGPCGVECHFDEDEAEVVMRVVGGTKTGRSIIQRRAREMNSPPLLCGRSESDALQAPLHACTACERDENIERVPQAWWMIGPCRHSLVWGDK